MSSSISQRLAPFLDVLGALLIFGSWFASNAISNQAQSQNGAHQGLVDRVRHFRVYEDFAGRTRALQDELRQTRKLVETSVQSAQPAAAGGAVRSEPPAWTGMTATQIRQMRDLVDDLEGYAGRASESESESATGTIVTVREGVDAVTADFQAAREEYEALVSADATSLGAEDRRSSAEDLGRHVDQLWDEYDAAKKKMLTFGDARLEDVAAEAASAGALAARAKTLSYVLYALGTLLILYGRARTSLAAKANDAA